MISSSLLFKLPNKLKHTNSEEGQGSLPLEFKFVYLQNSKDKPDICAFSIQSVRVCVCVFTHMNLSVHGCGDLRLTLGVFCEHRTHLYGWSTSQFAVGNHCLCSPSPGIAGRLQHSIYKDARNLSSGPHFCIACAFPTEPSAQ